MPSAASSSPADEIVLEWIQRYVPRHISRELWASTIRPFVVPALLELRPKGEPTAQHMAWALSRLATWCLEQRIPLTRDSVLDPDTVERFCSIGLRGLPARAQYRTVLRAIGPVLTTSAPWPPAPERLPRRKLARPYAPSELDGIWEDAHRQSTPIRRRAALALVTLGAGVGLDGRWSTRVRGTHIARGDGVVLVEVGSPSPRLVPVLARYEDELLRLAEEAGDDLLVGRRTTSRNRANELARRFEIGRGRPRVSASRLRSTWLVEHLAMGTRIPELADAAGLEGTGVLTDLLAFVPRLPEGEARRMLRGAR